MAQIGDDIHFQYYECTHSKDPQIFITQDNQTPDDSDLFS